jgi:hypothetical protein
MMARLTLRIMRYPTDYEGSGNAEIGPFFVFLLSFDA